MREEKEQKSTRDKEIERVSRLGKFCKSCGKFYRNNERFGRGKQTDSCIGYAGKPKRSCYTEETHANN